MTHDHDHGLFEMAALRQAPQGSRPRISFDRQLGESNPLWHPVRRIHMYARLDTITCPTNRPTRIDILSPLRHVWLVKKFYGS